MTDALGTLPCPECDMPARVSRRRTVPTSVVNTRRLEPDEVVVVCQNPGCPTVRRHVRPGEDAFYGVVRAARDTLARDAA